MENKQKKEKEKGEGQECQLLLKIERTQGGKDNIGFGNRNPGISEIRKGNQISLLII